MHLLELAGRVLRFERGQTSEWCQIHFAAGAIFVLQVDVATGSGLDICQLITHVRYSRRSGVYKPTALTS